MNAIIKTLPTFIAHGRIDEFLAADFCRFYFTLGLGRPQRGQPDLLYFTYAGKILGHFRIEEIVRHEGQLPKLTTLDGQPSAWQIKLGRWVAICAPPFHHLREELFHSGFRGWRYFDLEKYRGTLDAKIPL